MVWKQVTSSSDHEKWHSKCQSKFRSVISLLWWLVLEILPWPLPGPWGFDNGMPGLLQLSGIGGREFRFNQTWRTHSPTLNKDICTCSGETNDSCLHTLGSLEIETKALVYPMKNRSLRRWGLVNQDDWHHNVSEKVEVGRGVPLVPEPHCQPKAEELTDWRIYKVREGCPNTFRNTIQWFL